MLFSVPRPDDEEELHAEFLRHHNCQNAREFRAALDDRDVDLITFPVGHSGSGMPLYTPFVVTATAPCMVCGKLLSTWFQWTGTQVVSTGTSELWVP